MTITSPSGHKYQFPEGWSDIQLSKYLSFLKDVDPLAPKELLEIVTEEDPLKREQLRKAVSPVTYSTVFAPYFAKFVAFWAGMDEEELLGKGFFEGGPVMTWKQLEKLWSYLEARLAQFPHNPSFKSFFIGKQEFFLPNEFMKGSTVVEFAEISQFEAELESLESGNWPAMSKIMAVICRPMGEYYDHTKVEHRAKMFEGKVTMDIVINISFFLSKLSKKYVKASQIYTLSYQLARRKRDLKNLKKTLVGT